MNTEQALAHSALATAAPPDVLRVGPQVLTSQQVKERMVRAERRSLLCSASFRLVELPLNRLASPFDQHDHQAHVEAMLASVDSGDFPVADFNIKGLGETSGGFRPKVVVIEGGARVRASRQQGHERMRVWIGDRAMGYVASIRADHQLGAQELRTLLGIELEKEYPAKRNKQNMIIESSPWIQEVYPLENYFVFSRNGHYWKQSYTVTLKDRSVKLDGKPEEVTQRYVPLTASSMNLARAAALEAGPGSASMGGGSGPAVAMNKLYTKKKAVRAAITNIVPKPSDELLRKLMPSKTSDMAVRPRINHPVLPGAAEKGRPVPTKATDAVQAEKGGAKMPHGGMSKVPHAPSHGHRRMRAERKVVKKIITKFRAACMKGYKAKMESVAPPGMEKTVLGLKKHFKQGSAAPFKLAWFLHDKKKGSGK